MVTFEDPNLIIGILGIILTIITFYVTYKQTIGASIERKAAVRRDLVSSVSRLVAHDQLDVNQEIIQGLIRSKAREYNINFENMPNPIAIFEDSMTKFIENEFMSQETKKGLINKILSVQRSYLDTAKIIGESKEEATEEIPFEILISTITSLIIGIIGIYVLGSLTKSLYGTTFIITDTLLLTAIIITVTGLTIILYLRIMADRQKKLSENKLYSGKEFENLVFSTIVKYIGERGNVKRNYLVISEDGRKWEIDLLIELSDKKIPIEIKYRKDNISIDSIYQLISDKKFWDLQKAIIITNAQITKDAKILAEQNDIITIEKVRNEADITNVLNHVTII
ncbi:MAG: restriction endonuclease [Candidatus Methanoperedens sp.]|nr:restriction endonuclease [Candidatus Methanoperedens sp.]